MPPLDGKHMWTNVNVPVSYTLQLPQPIRDCRGFLQPQLITTTLCLPLERDVSHCIKSIHPSIIHCSLRAVSLLHTVIEHHTVVCRNKRCPVDLKVSTLLEARVTQDATQDAKQWHIAKKNLSHLFKYVQQYNIEKILKKKWLSLAKTWVSYQE